MDELVKSLRKMQSADYCAIASAEDFPAIRIVQEAADAIEELSRENESLAKSVNEASEILRKRWIPVTERLPENPRDVLVTLKSFLRPNAVYLNFAAYENGAWYEPDGSSPFRIANDRVTHWMPLPEPPKEEK